MNKEELETSIRENFEDFIDYYICINYELGKFTTKQHDLYDLLMNISYDCFRKGAHLTYNNKLEKYNKKEL